MCSWYFLYVAIHCARSNRPRLGPRNPDHHDRDHHDRMILLVLRGAPARPCDSDSAILGPDYGYESTIADRVQHSARLGRLLRWADDELETYHNFYRVVIGGGVHGDRDVAPAQRSQLLKLRGDGNTDVRMRIARALGVRVGEELGQVRRVRGTWRRVCIAARLL